MRLPKEGAVSMRAESRDSEQHCKIVEEKNDVYLLFFNTYSAVYKVRDPLTKGNELKIKLNDYELTKIAC